MNRIQVMALAVLAVGCPKSSVTSTDASAASASPIATPSAAPSAASAGGGSWDTLEMTCDSVLPKASRDKLGITSMKLDPSGGKHGSLTCGFVDQKDPGHVRTFMYECKGRPAEKPASDLAIQESTFKGMAKDAKLVPGVGRWAIVGTAMGINQMWIMDDKTPCKVTISGGIGKTELTADDGHATLDAFHAAVVK